jgi:hypothetical protein
MITDLKFSSGDIGFLIMADPFLEGLPFFIYLIYENQVELIQLAIMASIKRPLSRKNN